MTDGRPDFAATLAAARACTLCAAKLPLGPRPVVRGSAAARILIVSQAPGTKAHESDLSFNDPSGDRLRDWMGIGRDIFYDEGRVAMLPMGFCYPGRLPGGGDAPPRPECAPLWHPPLIAGMGQVGLTLLVGGYALRAYLPRYGSMTAAVEDWRAHLPGTIPLPHPSWRTTAWERRHPWFREELIPELRRRVAALM